MQQRSGQNHVMIVSMTEKKLNNYLQQAKYLMGSNVQDKAGKKQSKNRIQNYSIDNNEYQNIDSSNSSKVLFNAAGALATSSSNDKSDPLTDTQMRQSFLSLKKVDEDKKMKKQNDYKTRSSQLKDKKQKMLAKIKTSDNNVFDKVSTHRYSDQTKSTFIKTPQKDERPSKTFKKKQTTKLLVSPVDQVIAEEQHYEVDKNMEDIVLSLDFDGQQMDLGALKSLNKRQSSKTEVGPPLGGTLSKHKKNQVSNVGQQKQVLLSKVSVSHKKTSSYFTQTDTRNHTLHHKHMTTTTSPVMERIHSEKISKHTTEKKKQEPRNSNIQKKIVVSKTVEIKEDQNEDEDQDKKVDVHNQISPSAQSSFSFQPKFFKPTNLPIQNLGKHSLSMEDHLTTSTLQTQQILKKDLSKKL